jgi:hypothetical protein
MNIQIEIIVDQRPNPEPPYIYYEDSYHGDDVKARLIDGELWLSEYDDGINEFVNTRKVSLSEFIEIVVHTTKKK